MEGQILDMLSVLAGRIELNLENNIMSPAETSTNEILLDLVLYLQRTARGVTG